jgi:hypothetical protein
MVHRNILKTEAFSRYIPQSPIKCTSRQRAGFFDVWRVDYYL